MLPHQQRVVEEKEQLDEKISALAKFIHDNPMYLKLDESEQFRLRTQHSIMDAYSLILESRIKAF